MSTKTKTTLHRPMAAPAKAGRESTSALHPLLDTMTIAEAVHTLCDLVDRFRLAPNGDRANLNKDIAAIRAAAEFFDIEFVRDLVDAQRHVLAHLLKVPSSSVTKFLASSTAQPMHRYRNVLVAIAMAGAQSVDLGEAANVARQAIQLQRRATGGRRALYDDEILLLRVAVLIESLRKPTSPRAGVYTMVEAGMAPGETTSARLNDASDPEAPAYVLAAGNGHLDSRILPLDEFGQFTFGRLTSATARTGSAPEALLTYRPRKNKPGSEAATASAQGVLDGLLKDLGLFNSDITASSICLWRIHTVLQNDGTEAATKLSGRSTPEQMYRSLGTIAPTKHIPIDQSESFLDD